MKAKMLLFSILIFLFSTATFPQAPNWQWSGGMGALNIDEGNSIAIDNSGYVYTTGLFWGTVDFDPGAGIFNLTSASVIADVFISKLDSLGNFIWAKSIGGTDYDEGNGIAVDVFGNVYVTGQFGSTADFDPGAGTFNLTSNGNYDIFICKLNSSGNFVWANAMGGGSDDVGRSLAIDSLSGYIYATGIFSSTVDFDPGAGTFNLTSHGSYDIFISKLDGSGNFVWAKAMGGTSGDQCYSIAVDASGSLYATGVFDGSGDFDPGPGVFNLSSAGITDIFVSKLNSSGNLVWAKAMGGTTPNDIGFSIALDISSNVYSTGVFGGTADFDPGPGTCLLTGGGGFVSKLDSAGYFVWAKQIGGGVESIASDTAGNIYTTGSFAGTADFDPGPGTFNLTAAGSSGNSDIFITKLDSAGNFIWANGTGGINNDVGQSITVNVFGYLYVTGNFRSPLISFGSDTLTNAGSSDIFIARLDTSTGTPTGNNEMEFNNGASIFPNPFSKHATIKFSHELSAATLRVYNLFGQLMIEKNNISGREIILTRKNLGSGIYIYEVTDKEKKICKGKAVVY